MSGSLGSTLPATGTLIATSKHFPALGFNPAYAQKALQNNKMIPDRLSDEIPPKVARISRNRALGF